MEKNLSYKGYTTFVNYSEVDKVYYGKIDGINDLVSFEVSTEGELENQFREAVDDYLETCEGINKTPQRP